MTNKKLTIISVSLLLLFLIATFASLRQKAQEKPQKDEPTIVSKGQATKKEQAFSKEYKKQYGFRNDEKLTEFNDPDGIVITVGSGSFPKSTDAPVTTIDQFFHRLSCQSDAVVVGRVKNKESHLSSDETFVFTTYDFQIERIIKRNPNSPIEINKSITVAKPGGFIKIDKQIIRFNDTSYKPYELNKKYLLFLRFVPEADGYTVANPTSDFVLENNSFKSLTKHELVEGLNDNTDQENFLEIVQSTVTGNCNQGIPVGGNKNE